MITTCDVKSPLLGPTLPIVRKGRIARSLNPVNTVSRTSPTKELELIQTQMAQKPMLRAEVGIRVRCANKASAE